MRAEVRAALDNALGLGSSTGGRRHLSRGALRAYVYAVLVELTDFTVQELCDELCIAANQGGEPDREDA